MLTTNPSRTAKRRFDSTQTGRVIATKKSPFDGFRKRAFSGTLNVKHEPFSNADHPEMDPHVTEEPEKTVPDLNKTVKRSPLSDELLNEFRSELRELNQIDKDAHSADSEYHSKAQAKAVSALAKIMGIRRAYFDEAAPEVTAALMETLRQWCRSNGIKNISKRTTEFHLLSRFFRKSDRRQASADALVLIRAHNEGQTEQTFPQWVADKGGLTAARNKDAEEKREKAKAAKGATKIDPEKIRARLKAEMKKGKGTSLWNYRVAISYSGPDDEFAAWLPEDKSWEPVIARREGDRVVFYTLQAPQSDSSPQGDQKTI
ncbi:enoyl-CoA hydratase/isomerase family protein [Burkholderia gladioli]|uniref:enoyl-CoA hydratase/isomerase family protein n=1 Tax=Burkholderia gladioli TaxID=28095 RepID=UPI0013F69186|nr:enoyl-CoA hydratase/isomerase family protein [Burkholderia gladioli]NHH82137.1 hypothetical protein [Burkholderia gladioli]